MRNTLRTAETKSLLGGRGWWLVKGPVGSAGPNFKNIEMETLQIEKKEALNIYNDVDAAGKLILQRLFGKDKFQKDFREIDSFEIACPLIGEDPQDEKFSSGTVDEIAYKRLKVSFKAINGDWVADYNNSNQKKWSPVFVWDERASGFRFLVSYYVFTHTLSTGGSRLCCESKEKSDHIGKTFIKDFNNLLH